MKDNLQETLKMLMLEMLDSRRFEDPEMKHSYDTRCTKVAHADNEILQVVMYMDMALLKQNCKMH